MGHSNEISQTVANMPPEVRAQLEQAGQQIEGANQQMREQQSGPAPAEGVQAARDAERSGDERMQTRTDDLVKGEAQLPEHIQGNLKDYNTQQLDQRAAEPPAPTPPQQDMEPER